MGCEHSITFLILHAKRVNVKVNVAVGSRKIRRKKAISSSLHNDYASTMIGNIQIFIDHSNSVQIY